MVTEDKNQDKERVVSAITALKTRGAEITPFTVADEAQIPRSTLYRNPELMDLINEQGGGLDDADRKIAQLEERNAELSEIIWTLEQQNEVLTKLQQDSYQLGFQAGIEEATRKLGAGQPESQADSQTDAEIRARRRETAPLAKDDLPPPQLDTGPLPPVELAANGDEPLTPTPPKDEPAHTPLPAKTPAAVSTGEFEPLTSAYEFGVPKESTFAESFQFGAGSLTSEEPRENLAAVAKTVPLPLEAEPSHSEQSFAQLMADSKPTKSAGDGRSAAKAESKLTESSISAPQFAIHAEPDSIYNIARSGPTISSSSYNPLVELSWKDLETVYNFSVASLKDYAKQSFGTDTSPMGGVNFADQSTQERIPTNKNLESEEEAQDDASPSQEGYIVSSDPRRTGDRLQALSDPRNLLDSDAVVDLDALDIFDDLDDYVDLDKIEIINDVITKPASTPEDMATAGDELRELIKGRIKQASDIPHEPAAPRTTAPPGAQGKEGDAAKPGSRSKFIGGAKAGQDPPPASTPFLHKQIPPEIRKACMILGIKPEEATQRSVIIAWKDQIASPGVHPDLGGDTEAAVYLNTAKDTLVRWLDAQAPKLGKKFAPKDPPKDPAKDPAKDPKDPKDSDK